MSLNMMDLVYWKCFKNVGKNIFCDGGQKIQTVGRYKGSNYMLNNQN